MSEFKRLLDEGSEMDRMLLSSAVSELPPARSVEKTLAALGVGSVVAAAGGSALGAASATLEVAGGTAPAASLGGASVVKGGFLGLGLVKVAVGVALSGAALGGGYWMAAHEAEQKARVELAGSAKNDRLGGGAELVGEPLLVPGPASAGQQREVARDRALPSDPGQARTLRSARGETALGGEVELLDQARKALLAGDSKACLARLQAYRTRFPQGQLKAEADELEARAKKRVETH
jgi:hypothetical protein